LIFFNFVKRPKILGGKIMERQMKVLLIDDEVEY